MRNRWIRGAGLGLALLTAVVLAVSPVAAAQPVREPDSSHDSPGQRAQWLDPSTRKALRATDQPGTWEILVELEQGGAWTHQGFLKEVYRRRPEPAATQDEALREIFESYGTALLIGEVQPSKGSPLYIVGAVHEQNSPLQDLQGTALKPFVPLHVNKSHQGSLQHSTRPTAAVSTTE